MSGHKPWSEIRHKARPEEIAEAKRMIEEATSWYVRLGRGLKEFFNPKDWVPSIPLPSKCRGEGCQDLLDAIAGFPKKEKK